MSLVINTTAHAQDSKEFDAETWSAAHHAADAFTYCHRAGLALRQDLIDKTPAEVLETCTTGSRAGGRTVLMLLAECGKDKGSEAASLIKQLFEKSPASRDLTDLNGNTPLMQAAATGNAAVVRVLVSLGADVNATNNFGKNAWMKAKDNRDVLRELRPFLNMDNPTSSGGGDPASMDVIRNRRKIERKYEAGIDRQKLVSRVAHKYLKERSLAFR